MGEELGEYFYINKSLFLACMGEEFEEYSEDCGAEEEKIVHEQAYCLNCKKLVPLTEFKFKDGVPYENCVACFAIKNKEYWARAKFNVCKACGLDLPIREFDFGQGGTPFFNCRKCYEAETLARRERARAASNRLDFEEQPQPIGKRISATFTPAPKAPAKQPMKVRPTLLGLPTRGGMARGTTPYTRPKKVT